MKYFSKAIVLFLLTTTYSLAGMFDIPLRGLSLNSEISINNEAFSKMSVAYRFMVQSGKIKNININQTRPNCGVVIYQSFNSDETFVPFKIDSIEGAVIVDKEEIHNFRTTMSISNQSSFAEITCNNPIKYGHKIEEITINDFSRIFKQLIKIENLSLSPGNFENRYGFQLTPNFVFNDLVVKPSQELALINTDDEKGRF